MITAVHPPHENQRALAPGVWGITLPIDPRGILGWQVRRECRKSGGHGGDGMIAASLTG